MAIALITGLSTLVGVYVTAQLCYAELVRPHDSEYDYPQKEYTDAT